MKQTNHKICELSIEGMHCESCELFLEEMVNRQKGVVGVATNAAKQQVIVTLTEDVKLVDFRSTLQKLIEPQGYSIRSEIAKEKPNLSKIVSAGLLALVVFVGYIYLQRLELFQGVATDALTYPAIFLIGVLASISTCMAVVGGVVLSLSARLGSQNKQKGIVLFHVARLLGFILLGAVTGYIGKALIISATVSVVLRILVALAMIGVGAELLGLKLFRVVLPKGISRALGTFSDKEGLSGAATLGVVTYFLPCGFTQSIQLYALSTASALTGALVMGVFALGTLPVLGVLSVGAVSSLKANNFSLFSYFMGALLVIFALYNVFTALATLGIHSFTLF